MYAGSPGKENDFVNGDLSNLFSVPALFLEHAGFQYSGPRFQSGSEICSRDLASQKM